MRLNSDMFGMSLGERLSVLLGVACLLIAVGMVIAGCSPAGMSTSGAPAAGSTAPPAH